MQIEDGVAQPRLGQPCGERLRRPLVRGDDEHGAAPGHGRRDPRRDGLAEPGAGRPLDREVVTGGDRGDGAQLCGVELEGHTHRRRGVEVRSDLRREPAPRSGTG